MPTTPANTTRTPPLVDDPMDLLLGADGDLVVVADADWARGLAAIAQGVRIAILMIRGEWFADLDDGVPYYEREGVSASEAILAQRFDQRKAYTEIYAAIQRAPGVNEVVSLDVQQDTVDRRKLRVTWVVRTVFGDTDPDSLSLGVK